MFTFCRKQKNFKMKNFYPTFVAEGAKMMNRKNPHKVRHTDNFDREFRTLFGCSPVVCATIWVKCKFEKKGVLPKHLLWTLMFLKLYETERVHITIAGMSDRQVFREKVWPIIAEIAALRKFVVSFQKSFLILLHYFNL